MATPVRIYYDYESFAVIFNQSSVINKFTHTLHAVGMPATGTITIYDTTIPDILGSDPGLKMFVNLLPADVRDVNGNVVGGAVLGPVVDYLNGQFYQVSTNGTVPTITSSDVINATTGEGVNYRITTAVGDNPTSFAVTGLPAGLHCESLTGWIRGSTAVAGAHAITLHAINIYGTTDKAATLTVSGAFINSKSTNHEKVKVQFVDRFPLAMGGLKIAPNAPWTWSAWVKRTEALGSVMGIMSAGLRDSTDKDGWQITMGTTGKVIVKGGVLSGGAKWISATSTNVVFNDTTTWHNICVTYDGTVNFDQTKLLLYIDGALDATAVKASSAAYNNAAWPAGDFYFSIGRDIGANHLGARVDEVSVWGSVLTAPNIAAIWNGGAAADLSVHAAWANCVSWWRMGDGDIHPDIVDAKGVLDLVMYNMTAASFVNDAPV